MVKSLKTTREEMEEMYAIVLRDLDLFGGNDTHEKAADAIITQIRDHMESGDAKRGVKAMMLRDNLKTAVIGMYYADMPPSDIPMEYLKHCLKFPSGLDKGSFLFNSKEQRDSIDGPTRAIRVYCVECQGGFLPGVRQCAASNCFLWPFRMGNNPFYGRLVGAEDESDETQEEIDAMEAERLPDPSEQVNGDTTA